VKRAVVKFQSRSNEYSTLKSIFALLYLSFGVKMENEDLLLHLSIGEEGGQPSVESKKNTVESKYLVASYQPFRPGLHLAYTHRRKVE